MRDSICLQVKWHRGRKLGKGGREEEGREGGVESRDVTQ